MENGGVLSLKEMCQQRIIDLLEEHSSASKLEFFRNRATQLPIDLKEYILFLSGKQRLMSSNIVYALLDERITVLNLNSFYNINFHLAQVFLFFSFFFFLFIFFSMGFAFPLCIDCRTRPKSRRALLG
jgi:hypothetical protein